MLGFLLEVGEGQKFNFSFGLSQEFRRQQHPLLLPLVLTALVRLVWRTLAPRGIRDGLLGPQMAIQGGPLSPVPRGPGVGHPSCPSRWNEGDGQEQTSAVQASGDHCRWPNPPQTLSVKTTAMSRTPGYI